MNRDRAEMMILGNGKEEEKRSTRCVAKDVFYLEAAKKEGTLLSCRPLEEGANIGDCVS
jgi:hypothetical protein